MEFNQGLEIINQAVFSKIGRQLNAVEIAVLRGVWLGQSYEQIAEMTSYSTSYLSRTFCPRLWQLLSQSFGEPVSKKSFRICVERLEKLQPKNLDNLDTSNASLNISSNKTLCSSTSYCDWGEAIDVSVFYGRTQELETLTQWIVQDCCRLVALVGMGGIGKTSLSVRLAQQIRQQFQFIIWRSLRNAPQLDMLLLNLIQVLSCQQQTALPDSLDLQISLVMSYLRSSKCLLILDNLESILQGGTVAGEYRLGYENYGELLRQVGETPHLSCIILTSREKPETVAMLEGDMLAVRSLMLSGLPLTESHKLFDTKGLSQSQTGRRKLIEAYNGNPLALKIMATSIRELFDGDIDEFLSEGNLIYNGLRKLLNQQFERLTPLEKQIMYWLAIQREGITISKLQTNIMPSIPGTKVLEALESLIHRSLIEQSAARFTQHPLVMEYIIEQVLERSNNEIYEQLGNAIEPRKLMAIFAGMGQVLFELSKFRLSVTAYQKMLAVAQSCGDSFQEAEALYNIAYGFFWSDEIEPALEYCQQAYALALGVNYKNIKNILAASAFLTGYMYSVTAKLKESVGYFTQALQLSREIGDKRLEGLNLCLLGMIYNWKGEYESAIQLGDQGIALGEAHSLQTTQLMSFWQRGLTRGGKGDYELAIADLETGLYLSSHVGDKIWKCRILNTLGWLYGELYHLEPAIEYNKQAQLSALKIGDPEIIRNAEINLGDYYMLQKDLEKAAEYLEKVYRDCQQSDQWGKEWRKWRYLQHCCHSLGELRLVQGNLEQALILAQECIQLAEATFAYKNLVKGWRLMGQVFASHNQPNKAEAFFKKAIDLSRTLNNPPQIWKTYQAQGNFYLQCELTQQAATAYHNALQVIEETASRLQSKKLKQIFLWAPPVQKIHENLKKVKR